MSRQRVEHLSLANLLGIEMEGAASIGEDLRLCNNPYQMSIYLSDKRAVSDNNKVRP